MAAASARSALSFGGPRSAGRLSDSHRAAGFVPLPAIGKNVLSFDFARRGRSSHGRGQRRFEVSASSSDKQSEQKIVPVDVTAPSGSRNK